jgi:hypothetical protein
MLEFNDLFGSYNTIELICIILGLILLSNILYKVLSLMYDIIIALLRSLSFTYCLCISNIQKCKANNIKSNKINIFFIVYTIKSSTELFFIADNYKIISDDLEWYDVLHFKTYNQLNRHV